jgi:protein-S-isoprenylcysteine O-methyltransferase Ste14
MTRPLRVALTFLVGDAIFVAVPLATWGLGDVRGFASDGVRLAYVVVVLALNALAAARTPAGGAPREAARRTVGRQKLALLVLQLVPLALVAVAPWSDRRGVAVLPDAPALRAAGLVAYAAGFLLVHWSEAHLGRLFSVQIEIQEDHRLVTDGPFRVVRHPRYAGILLFLSGIALVFRSWLALALVVPVLAVLLWRISDEDALLRETFGREWDAYAGRTRRLVPFAW